MRKMTRKFPKNIISEINDVYAKADETFAPHVLDLIAPDFAYEGALPIDEDPADYFGIQSIKGVKLG